MAAIFKFIVVVGSMVSGAFSIGRSSQRIERKHQVTKTHLLKTLLAGVLLIFTSLAVKCPDHPTYGTKWQGDFSGCIGTSADKTIQTIGGDVGGLNQEFGVVTPSYSNHPGCDGAFVTDYLMPTSGTNVNPGWHWAWMHVASRIPNINQQGTCTEAWTSLRVYAYWTFQGTAHEELLLESYRKGLWNGNNCDFGIPDNVWISSSYTRVRAVTQHGAAFISLQPHYSYFVTNNHP